jgi:hypothetical protein
MSEILQFDALNLIYAAIVLISFVFALLTLIGAGVGEVLDFSGDVDADSGMDFISISPFALAMFGAAFGVTGLLTRLWLEMEAIPTILWSLGTGLVIGFVAQAIFIYVLSPSKTSHFNLAADATGRQAEVVITVPTAGLGQIAYDNISGHVTLGARSASGQTIPRGAVVAIERVIGRVAVVHPIEESEQ